MPPFSITGEKSASPPPEKTFKIVLIISLKTYTIKKNYITEGLYCQEKVKKYKVHFTKNALFVKREDIRKKTEMKNPTYKKHERSIQQKPRRKKRL